MLNFLRTKTNEGKLTAKDVGYLEDAFVFLCHAVADESHCLGNFLSTSDENYLYDLEKAREIRSFIADMITKDVIAQNWCRLKHICGKAMTCQELITRHLSMGDLETAKKLAERYRELYFQYLKILGVDKDTQIKSETSA